MNAITNFKTDIASHNSGVQRLIGCCIAAPGVAALVVGLALMLIKAHDPTLWAFRHEQQALAKIVARVKAAPMSREFAFYQVDRSLDPATLRPLNDNGSDEDSGRIFARRDANGNFQVEIVLDDEGHLGRFGLVYSDSPLTFHMTDQFQQFDGGFYFLSIREKLADKWWYGYNDCL